MHRTAATSLALCLLVVVLAGCADGPSGGTSPPIGVQPPAEGDKPVADPLNLTSGPEPVPDTPRYIPPNATPPPNDRPPVINFTATMIPSLYYLRVNYTITGYDPEGKNIVWAVDMDGDNRLDASGVNFPANLTQIFNKVGDYGATILANDGFHEVKKVLDFQVTDQDLAPFLDVSGTFQTGGVGCQVARLQEGLDYLTFYGISQAAGGQIWSAHFNLSKPYASVDVAFYDDKGTPDDTSDDTSVRSGSTFGGDGRTVLEGTVPFFSDYVRVFGCGGLDVSVHLVIISQAWCRPAGINCKVPAQDPIEGE